MKSSGKEMKHSLCGTTLSSAIALLVWNSGPAAAQVAPGTPADAEKPSGGIEEIVVTAEKRAERIQDVPISISALRGSDVAAQRVATTEDIKYLVPALNWSVEAGFSAPFLRGIGTDVFLPDADTDVATYVDGVFIADDTSSVTSLMYLDRVEVLEGPQGTLYGRNAVAGAISVVTQDPGATWEGDTKVGFGDYAEKEGSAYVSGPLADNFYAGVYAAYSTRNSYEHHLIPADQLEFNGQPSHEGSLDWRVKAIWNLDWLKLTGTYEHVETQSADANTFRNVYPNAIGYVFGAPKVIENYVDADIFPGYNKVVTNFAALREESNFDWGSIVGISGYHDNVTRIASSIDGTGVPFVGQIVDPQTGQQFSQELQILSPDSAKIKWIGGVYLFWENGAYDYNEVVSEILAPNYFNRNTGSVQTQSAAVFGQTTVPVLDKLDLTLGARYTVDYKDFYGIEYQQTCAFGCIQYQLQDPNGTKQHKKWEQFDPKITLNYRLDDNVLLYATYTSGFKSGVFNQAAPIAPGPVNPEKLTDYEVGAKSDLFGGRVRLNASAYYYDFSDIQVQVNNGGTAGGAQAILENAAKAEALGVEATAQVLVTSDLKVSGNIAYEYSKYTSFDGAVSYVPAAVGLTQVFVNNTGEPLQRAPKWTGTISAQYTIDLPEDFTSAINLSWYYNGGFNWEPSGALKEKSYNTLNGSFSLFSPDGLWTGTIWCKNMTNEYYREVALITGFGILSGDAPPRMFGATLERKFGGGAAPAEYTPPPPPLPAPAAAAPVATPEAARSFQVFFDFDKSDITAAAAKVIQAAADAVKAGHVVQITVTGHTDTVGSASYNQGLSERRAASVKQTLVADGVAGGEITTIGVGKTGLLVPTADGVREPQNRRAEIVLQ
jgi:iron complex outermembrane receptor protein